MKYKIIKKFPFGNYGDIIDTDNSGNALLIHSSQIWT